jgi:hypothetical protein
MNFHQSHGFVQMLISLPYTFNDIPVMCTNEVEINNLSVQFESLWCGMDCLFISLKENQNVLLSFCQAIQCSRCQGESFVLEY